MTAAAVEPELIVSSTTTTRRPARARHQVGIQVDALARLAAS